MTLDLKYQLEILIMPHLSIYWTHYYKCYKYLFKAKNQYI